MKRYRPNPLVAVLDRLWWRIVMKDAPRTCPICNDEPTFEPHHLISRRHWRYRWDPRNGAPTGRKCHKNKNRILAWLEMNRPKQYAWYEQAHRSVFRGEKGPKIDLDEIHKSLLEQL